jgi:hypothetical protein
MLDDNDEAGYKAKIILLKHESHYSVPEIRRITNHRHDNNDIHK